MKQKQQKIPIQILCMQLKLRVKDDLDRSKSGNPVCKTPEELGSLYDVFGVRVQIIELERLASISRTRSCHDSLLGLSFVYSGRGRCLLQDEDHSGSRHHSFPGFPRLCSGMFPERFRNASLSVGSREIRVI